MARDGKMGVHLDVSNTGYAGRLEVIAGPTGRRQRGKFVWPQVRDGIMRLSAAQFAALFEGLDWRLVRPEQRRSPQLAG